MPEAEKKRAMITSLRYSGACEYANSGPADTKRQKSLWISTNSPHGKMGKCEWENVNDQAIIVSIVLHLIVERMTQDVWTNQTEQS